MTARRYERTGLLALDPKALLELFLEETDRSNECTGDVAIVNVRGPLEQRAGGWCDSYESISERIDAACETSAHSIVMRIDSPGGMVAGCFDAVRAIRAKCRAAGKRLVAHVDGHACSAGYALACAAERIYVSETAFVGSIGIIDTRVDVTANDALNGVRFALVTSGSRKADGHPHVALTEDELAETQSIVDSLAGVFFAEVSRARGVSAVAIKSLDARILHGASAVDARLADAVVTFEGVLALLDHEGGKTMSKLDDARALLEEAAKGEGEEADKAKKALACMDESESGDDDEEASGDDKPADDEESEKPPKDEDEEASATSSAVRATATMAAAVTDTERRLRMVEKELEDTKREKLFASRPDISVAVKKALAKAPLSMVREVIDGTPKQALKPAATAVVNATRGEGQVEGKSNASGQASGMDRAMGLAPKQGGTRREHGKTFFGIVTREQAREMRRKAAAQ